MTKTFEEILFALDNQPDILDCKYEDGSSVWLSIRFDLRMINFFNQADSSAPRKKIKQHRKREIIKYVLYSMINTPWLDTSQIEILSIANYENNKTVPNIWTYFIRKLNGIRHKELLYSHEYYSFSGIKNTLSFDYFYNVAKIKSKWNKCFIKRDKTNFNKKVDDLFYIIYNKVKDYIIIDDLNNLKKHIIHINALSGYYEKQLLKYLKKVKPKIIITSEGNNGDWKYGTLFRVANDLGIPTAEVQHGAFGLGMVFGKQLIRQPEFQRHKSKFLFTFGEYHNSKSNAALFNIAMGNYKLELINNSNIISNEYKSCIVIFSEGIPPSSINGNFMKTVSSALKNYKGNNKIVIRLHPSEEDTNFYRFLFKEINCSFHTGDYMSMYGLVRNCECVIGHNTTALFEALYFDKMPLIFEDSVSEQFISSELGIWFRDAHRLSEILNNREYLSNNKKRKNHFWKEGNFSDNFLRFYKNL